MKAGKLGLTLPAFQRQFHSGMVHFWQVTEVP